MVKIASIFAASNNETDRLKITNSILMKLPNNNKIMVKKIIWLILIPAILFKLPSCTNADTKKATGQNEGNTDSTDAAVKYYASVAFLLPSPGEIIERFYDAKIKYYPELLNSPDNKSKYIGSKEQALNLGVYIADMSYSALFERSSETIEYLESIQSLSIEAGISSAIFESLVVRSKANAGKIDSLVIISNEAFGNMLEFLETGGREITIAQISAGSYIESLYIALNSVKKYSKDNKILSLVIDMKYPLENLLEKTKSETRSNENNILLNYLSQLGLIFNELETRSTKTTVSKKPTGELTVMGGDQISMSETDFINLKNKVSKIRKSIVDF